mmetsp:Transcript_44378/g.105096  ORF Transcript_44378/g.105096 Transcript_44378/m.105096 type:complete len:213 (+) Transcript_44378:191-829(+)
MTARVSSSRDDMQVTILSFKSWAQACTLSIRDGNAPETTRSAPPLSDTGGDSGAERGDCSDSGGDISDPFSEGPSPSRASQSRCSAPLSSSSQQQHTGCDTSVLLSAALLAHRARTSRTRLPMSFKYSGSPMESCMLTMNTNTVVLSDSKILSGRSALWYGCNETIAVCSSVILSTSCRVGVSECPAPPDGLSKPHASSASSSAAAPNNTTS